MSAADDLVKQLLGRGKKTKKVSAPVTVQPVTSSTAVQPVTPKTAVYPVTPAEVVYPVALPVIQATSSISVPSLAPQTLPSVRKFLHKSPASHADEDRELRDEKVLFVKLVEEYKASQVVRVSDQSAVLAVASNFFDSFPHLSCAGKGGKSSLNYNNLRNWRDGNAKRPGLRNPVTGNVDYERADLLLRNYSSERRRYGDDRFWTQLLAACNNQSENQIGKLYRLQVMEWSKHTPGADIPSLAQVYYELKKIPKRMLDLNRKGSSFYLQHYRDYNERDPESIRPNEGWVGDTQMLDFMIRVDTGKVDKEGHAIFVATRPWICVITDIKSEHVIAWEMGIGAIDNRVIRNAFGRGVWDYGRPFIFLTDNGKDYLKQGFTTPVVFTPGIVNSKVYSHSIMISLEIEHRRALAYNGRAKIVERFFAEMAKYYRMCRGYVGNCPANRPAEADVWTKPVTNEYLMGIEEACDRMADFIDIFHHTPAVGSKFLKGMTPDEAFAEERRIKRPTLTTQELYRRFLLPETSPRIVDARGSCVRVNGRRYVTLRQDREKMWPYDGKPVMVKFDLASQDYCFLFDLDGTYLTAAHKPQQLPYFCRTPEEKALLSQHQEWIASEISSLNTYTAEITKGFHKLDVSTSFGLPPEEFEGRAKLRKIDSKHSVKGETHNPAVYVPATEHKAMQLSRGEDIKTVCTKKTVQPVTPELALTDDMKEFSRLLVNHLTDTEEPEKAEQPAFDLIDAFQPQNKDKNDETYNPY